MKKNIILSVLLFLLSPVIAFASEADLKIPELSASQNNMLFIGIGVCVLGLLFGVFQFLKVKRLKAHQSMLDVAQVIYETCKTYLNQQGKFLVDGRWNSWLIWCCKIRNKDEYSCKQQDGLCIA